MFGFANAQNWRALEVEFAKLNKVTASPDRPGFIISISDHQKTLLSIESGAADLEHRALIDGSTVFHIASLSKQITGAALAHAIVEGKISLDDKVSDWIPATKKYGERLKVKHLLYMTSGLTEYSKVPRADGNPWATFHYFSTSDAIQASLSVDKLQFQPGDKWQYSNINYMLITELVAKAYKKRFSVVVKDKIFSPLGMHESLINDDITQVIPNRANAYLDRSEAVINELSSGAEIDVNPKGGYVMIRRNSPHYGGSGVMTSMNDWTKWQSEIITQDLFGKDFWKTMLSTDKFKHEKNNDAFGIVHGKFRGEPTLWYEGGDIDGSSYSITFRNRKLNISCFSNNPLDNCKAKVEVIMEKLVGDR
jgi:CubicO group peptidase (beta-lactamase class C family)